MAGVHRFLAGCGGWATRCRALRGPAAAPVDPTGDELALVRKVNWAIDKVTDDMTGRFTFNTAIAAVMELVNAVYQHSERLEEAPLRFATASAASLLFPFAPHLGSEVYEQTHRRARLGAAVARRRSGDAPAPTRSSSCARSTARSATGSPPPPGRPRRSSSRWRWSARSVQAHIDGHEIAKVIVVPDKLVNVVVR